MRGDDTGDIYACIMHTDKYTQMGEMIILIVIFYLLFRIIFYTKKTIEK